MVGAAFMSLAPKTALLFKNTYQEREEEEKEGQSNISPS